MKTRLLPLLTPVVAILVFAFLLRDTLAVTAEISPVTNALPDITVLKTSDANEDSAFSDGETTTLANPLSAVYQLAMTNNGAEVVTVTAILDTHHNLAGSSCETLIGTTLPAGSPVTCTFTGTFNKDNESETNTATVTVEDSQSITATATNTTTVHTIDIQPAITITKTNDANDDGTFTDEETATLGATVTFQVEIMNETAEAVTIDSIVDSIYGADAALTSAAAPQCADVVSDSIAGSGSTLCYFDGVITQDNNPETNIVTVTVSDDDTNAGDFMDDSTVNVPDNIPAVTVVKTNDADGDGAYSDVEQLPVNGSVVTFRLSITNDTLEATTIDSITDSEHGADAALITAVPGLPSCAALVGQPLAGHQTEICYFDGTVATNVPSETNTITVGFSDNDSNSDSAGDTSTVLVPRLAVSKTPDTQTVLIGDNASFTIAVTNTGGVDLTNVTVTDPAAPACNRTFASLPAGASQPPYICTKTGVMLDFTNVVTVTGHDTISGTVVVTDTAVVDVIDPRIAITKSPDVQEIPQGGNAQFTITVENTGDVPLTDVSVTDPEAPGCNASVGTLAVGGEDTYTCSLNDVMADFLNEATASGRHPLGGTVTADDTAFVDVNDPNIAIFKNPPVQAISKGDTATFNIAIVNTGQVNLTNVQVIDLFTPDCNRPNIGNLAPGADFTYTCHAVNVEERLVNVATVTGINPASGDPVGDSGVAVVEILDAAVTVHATPASLPAPGGNFHYTVTVTNEGSQAMSLTELNSNRYGKLSDPANDNVHNNNCDFTTPPTLAANGGDYSCTFQAEEKPRQPGDYHLVVTAVFNNGAASATGNTTVTITAPPTFHSYLPVTLNSWAVGEPNNSACQAYPIAVNQLFHFLADDSFDWYRFTLAESGNVVVELANFVPQSGQLLVYRDSSGCASLTNSDLIGQNGNFSTTKIVNLGQRPAGQYYIRIINDGVLNNSNPYRLRIIVDN